MTQLRIKFENNQLGPKFKRNRVRDGERVLAAARAAALDAQKELLTRGRLDIKQAGNFGRRWTDGLTAPITEGGGRIVLSVKHAVPYFMVFQKGRSFAASRCSGYRSPSPTQSASARATSKSRCSA
jgi:hypothetical protein